MEDKIYEPHQLRVIEEKDQLLDKYKKLSEFMTSGTFRGLDIHESELLIDQHEIMENYLGILDKRIKLF